MARQNDILKWGVIAAALVAFYYLVKTQLGGTASQALTSLGAGVQAAITGAAGGVGSSLVDAGTGAIDEVGNALGTYAINDRDTVSGLFAQGGSYQLNPSYSIPSTGDGSANPPIVGDLAYLGIDPGTWSSWLQGI